MTTSAAPTPSPSLLVFLDGEIVPLAEARVSPEDRGFLFGDAVYEAVPAYGGTPVFWDEHMARLAASLRGVRISFDELGALRVAAERLLEANRLRDADALVYVQISRGAAPRSHVFPDPPATPTVFVKVEPWQRNPESLAEHGVSAITVPDLRWARCDIKSVCLLANVLARQQAREAGAFEALLVRDGIVVEGSHANLLAVLDGQLVTCPASNYVLCGVTRNKVLALARDSGIPVREAPILLPELYRADELLLTGTTSEVLPVVQVDGQTIGDGLPGRTGRHLRREYLAAIRRARGC